MEHGPSEDDFPIEHGDILRRRPMSKQKQKPLPLQRLRQKRLPRSRYDEDG